MRMSRSGMRWRCGMLLLMPLVVIWVAPLVGPGHRGLEQLPSWLPLADVVFLASALFMLAAPFIVLVLMRRSRERLEALSIDLDQLVLLIGAAGSATVAMMALLLTALIGGAIAYPYPWAALGFLGVGFWCWRLRHVLR